MARYALVVARFYEDLAARLEAGARAVFEGEDGGEVEVFDVPGAFELGQAAQHAAQSGRFRGVACLGVVIRGETDHYDQVCAPALRPEPAEGPDPRGRRVATIEWLRELPKDGPFAHE